MRLIVDAQLPAKLCEILNQLGIESIHVDLLPKGDETPDTEITSYADSTDPTCHPTLSSAASEG